MNDLAKTRKPKFLRAKDVATYFFDGKISYARVLALTKDGKLPATRIGKCYYYTQEALVEWAEKNMGTPAWNGIR